MLRPTVKKVVAQDDFMLELSFDNGEQKSFDVKPYIKGEWYGKLNEKEYFEKVQADGFTVVWPEGQDICPDDLYELSISK